MESKQFSSLLVKIAKDSDSLADMIHQAGLYAIAQANTHSNLSPAIKLVEALGRKHDKQRVVTWLCNFSVIRVSKGALVKGKKIPDIDASEQADAMPYWELTPQPKLINKIDYKALLMGILKRHDNAQDNETVQEFNTELLEGVRTLLSNINTVGV